MIEVLPAQQTQVSLEDFKKMFPNLIPRNKRLILTSDFDETLCSNYAFDSTQRIHIPIINPRVADRLQQTDALPLLATSRSSEEAVVCDHIVPMLGTRDIPIICENGGILFFPNRPDSPKINLLTFEERRALQHANEALRDQDINRFFPEMEILRREDRFASIEMRVQTLTGEGGKLRQESLAQLLRILLDQTELTIVSSGNSVSVQPKNVSKASGIARALEFLELPRDENMFIIGLGDAENDKELLQMADLAIAVRLGAKPFADITVDEGEAVTLAVLEQI